MRIDPSAIYKKYQTSSQPSNKASQSSRGETLKEGQVLKGQILDASQDKVTIRLDNGETIDAKLSGDSSFSIGEEVAFVVKESGGDQLLISSLLDAGTQSEEQLLSILSEAGLPKTEENVQMLKEMIDKSLPIDKDSLNQMAKLMTKHSDTPVKDLVFLTKHQIPITESNLQQLQMLENNEQPLMRGMASLVDDLTTSLGKADQTLAQPQVGQEVMSQEIISQEGLEVEGRPTIAIDEQGASLMAKISEDQQALTFIKDVGQQITRLTNVIEGSQAAGQGSPLTSDVPIEASEILDKGSISQSMDTPINQMVMTQDSERLMASLESMVLTNNETKTLSESQQLVLKQLPESGDLSLSDVVKLADADLLTNDQLREFMVDIKASTTYQTLAKGLLLSDIKVIEEGEVNAWFKNVQDKVEQIMNEPVSDVVNAEVAKGAMDVKNTVEFMNNLQEDYQFMQLPMFMNDQLLTSEFYVMNNQKASKDSQASTTALVRLDLLNLGHTDIYIKKVDKNIDVQFYMTDESQISVMQDHVFELHKLLKDKGFNTLSATVQPLEKAFDIVNDFLDKGEDVSSKKRYSFDMRA